MRRRTAICPHATNSCRGQALTISPVSTMICGSWLARIREALKRFERDPSVAAIAFDILSPDKPTEQTRSQDQSAAMFIGCGHMLRVSAVAPWADMMAPQGDMVAKKKICASA